MEQNYFEFAYTLEDREILDGLRTSGIYKTSGKRAVIETAVLAAMGILAIVLFIVRDRQPFDLILGILCFIIIFALNWYPRHDMKKRMRGMEEDAKNIRLRVYEDKIYVYTNDTSVIDLRETTVKWAKKVKIFSLMPKAGGILILPEEKIPEADREKIIKTLMRNRED